MAKFLRYFKRLDAKSKAKVIKEILKDFQKIDTFEQIDKQIFINLLNSPATIKILSTIYHNRLLGAKSKSRQIGNKKFKHIFWKIQNKEIKFYYSQWIPDKNKNFKIIDKRLFSTDVKPIKQKYTSIEKTILKKAHTDDYIAHLKDLQGLFNLIESLIGTFTGENIHWFEAGGSGGNIFYTFIEKPDLTILDNILKQNKWRDDPFFIPYILKINQAKINLFNKWQEINPKTSTLTEFEEALEENAKRKDLFNDFLQTTAKILKTKWTKSKKK